MREPSPSLSRFPPAEPSGAVRADFDKIAIIGGKAYLMSKPAQR